MESDEMAEHEASVRAHQRVLLGGYQKDTSFCGAEVRRYVARCVLEQPHGSFRSLVRCRIDVRRRRLRVLC